MAHTPGSARPTQVTEEIRTLVKEYILEDDEITATKLYMLLNSRGFH